MNNRQFIKQISDNSFPFDKVNDLMPLLSFTKNKRLVLLGEASHGTHEFYYWRSEISKKLINEQQFTFIGVEGDWPDCYKVNRYIRGYPNSGKSAYEVLHSFKRWPTWMWANQEMVELVEWIKAYNREQPDNKKVGFYGLDVYSLWESLYEIINYLKKTSPEIIPDAIRAYLCFEPYEEDVQAYARATAFIPKSCEQEVVDLLKKIQEKQPKYPDDKEAKFNAAQNAYVLKGAEEYYRTMVYGGPESWNLRDVHMTDTLDRLINFFGTSSKAIVWAHNTHIGDARYTDMAQGGELNIGQLVRERHKGEGVVLVGFGTNQGTVIAGKQWDAKMEVMQVPRAKTESWENLINRAGSGNNMLFVFSDKRNLSSEWFRWRGNRAIGVVYSPQYEQYGNYIPTVLPDRYDAFIFIDKSSHIVPLHFPPNIQEVPETYPFGL